MSKPALLRRPKFRSLTAIAMLGFIVAGASAVGVAILVGLRKVAAAMGWTGSDASMANDTPRPSGMVALLWSEIGTYSFVKSIAFGVAMLLLAFLARKIVLSGLRD